MSLLCGENSHMKVYPEMCSLHIIGAFILNTSKLDDGHFAAIAVLLIGYPAKRNYATKV